MHSLQSIRELFNHMEWADGICWNAVFSSPDALADQVIIERLHHIHLVENAFLHVWRGLNLDFEAFNFSEPADLSRSGRQYHTDVHSFLTQLEEASLSKPVSMPWAQQMVQQLFGRDAAIPTLGETLFQVVMHSTYHRGQVAIRLRELGLEPPLTDYIAWIWLGKPDPEWPEFAS